MSFPRFLAWLVLAQAAGIVVAETSPAGVVFAALGLSFGVAAALRSSRFAAVVLAAATSAGAHGLALADAREPFDSGLVVADVRVESRRETGSGLHLWLRLGGPARPARVDLFVSRRELAAGPPIADAVPGERWRLLLRLTPLHPVRNPGASDRTRVLVRRGIGARAALIHPDLAVRTGTGYRGTFEARLLALRRWLAGPLEGRGAGGALLRALSLGDRSGLSQVSEYFVRLGIAHLLAISGLHLALILAGGYAVAGALLRRTADPGVGRDVRLPALFLALLAGAAYALVAGFGLSLRRALVFALATGLSVALRRPGAARSGFFVAAGGLLAVDPPALFDAGAQLSFAATGALVFAEPAAADRVRGWLHGALRVAATALAATTPVLAAHGLVVAPVGLLSNLLAVTWVGGVLLPVALGTVAAGTIDAGEWVVVAGVQLAEATVDLFALAGSRLPPLPPRGVATWGAVVASGLLGGVALRVRTTVGRAAIALVAVAVLRLWPGESGPGTNYAVFLDVGSGDALILRSGQHAVLVDGGLGLPGGVNLGRTRVLPALGALGIGRLDIVVATHADADHVGGLPAVLAALPVGALWLPAGREADPGFEALIEVARARGVAVVGVSASRAARSLGPGLGIEILWPPRDFVAANRNAGSVVLRVRLGQARILLSGDLEAAGERAVLATGRPLRSDVLKLGHHGSATSTLGAWLDRVQPQAAIVSAACDRAGLPAGSVLDRVRRRGISLWWPARDGAVFVGSDPLVLFGRNPGAGCPSRMPP